MANFSPIDKEPMCCETIAVLSHTSNTVGLFDMTYQVGSPKRLVLSPTCIPLEEWVRHEAILYRDTALDTSVVESVELYFDRWFESTYLETEILRLPHTVQIWEEVGEYPVYMLDPSIHLPWHSTVRCILRNPSIA